MTYTFFDLLRDSFEREVHAVNYHSENNEPVEATMAIGKLTAYSEILDAIGHQNEYEVELKGKCLPKVIKAVVDGKNLLYRTKEG